MTAGGLYVLVEMALGFIGTVLNVIVLATIKNSNRLLSEPAYLLIGVFDICVIFQIVCPFLNANLDLALLCPLVVQCVIVLS